MSCVTVQQSEIQITETTLEELRKAVDEARKKGETMIVVSSPCSKDSFKVFLDLGNQESLGYRFKE